MEEILNNVENIQQKDKEKKRKDKEYIEEEAYSQGYVSGVSNASRKWKMETVKSKVEREIYRLV